jgi:hypothetical protein
VLLEHRERRYAHAAADEQRLATVGRRREALPEWPHDIRAVPRFELAEAVRARADVLEQEADDAVPRVERGDRAR